MCWVDPACGLRGPFLESLFDGLVVWNALVDPHFLGEEHGTACRTQTVLELFCIDPRQFCAEKQNLSRVVHPRQQDKERARRPIRRREAAAAEI